MKRPKGYRDTFSRKALVAESERANGTIRQIQESSQSNQAQTIELQKQLSKMRTDGKSTLKEQSAVIQRIQRNNKITEDHGRQIGKLQVLITFNQECVSYIDWMHGGVDGISNR